METKPWYKSKTMWVNIASMILALADQFVGTGAFPSWAIAILAGANVALRTVTGQPVSAKAPS